MYNVGVAKRRQEIKPAMPVLLVLCISSGVSVGLFLIRVIVVDNVRYWFMFWNLFLAWLPVLFAFWLRNRLVTTRWWTWQNLLLTLLWLSFLPNSFYMVSDLIHLENTDEILQLYDVAMMTSLIANGLILGYMSVYVVHQELLKRLKASWAHLLIGLVLLSCGFAIYLGRYLRWNTWDVLINPAALLFDISDRIINPGGYPETFTITLVFFVLIASIYAVGYELVQLFKNNNHA
jgi:uncharacterized membrane protein